MLLKYQTPALVFLLTLFPAGVYLLAGGGAHGLSGAELAGAGRQWLVAAAAWLAMALLILRAHQTALSQLRALARGEADAAAARGGLLQRHDGLGALAREVNELVQALHLRRERLHQQQKVDAVTGLPNRSVVADRIEMAVARAGRGQRTFAVLLVDILKLSDINSRYGHHSGDVVLKILALRMRSMLRASDTICRFGSDQFLVVIEDGREEQLHMVVEKLTVAVNRYVSAQGDNIRVRAACGLAFFGSHGQEWEELLRRAEIATHAAKERNQQLVVYSDGQDESHLRSIMLQDDFHTAVGANEFRVLYQPKMSLERRDVHQVEALVRWHHRHLGVVSPDEFIPLAERSGQIKMLTHWVLEQAMRQQHRWHAQGRLIVISVNLSPLDLADEQILSVLETLTASFDVNPDYLVLEVTESAILEDISTAVSVINALRSRGYQISIDDFGTGYSSLAQIKRLPVRELKIDKSFVMRMQENSEDAVIVRSTIEMAHSLGLMVVAEGVESEEVLELLNSWHCDVIQGYHLAKPMTADDFDVWIDQSPQQRTLAARPAAEQVKGAAADPLAGMS